MRSQGAERASRTARIAAVAAGFLVVAGLGFMAVTGFIPLREGQSLSASGDSGFSYMIRILRKLGYRVSVLYDSPDLASGGLGPGDSLIPLDVDLSEDMEGFLSWVDSGGRLFLPATSEGSGYWSPEDLSEVEGGLIAEAEAGGGAAFPVPYAGMAFPPGSGAATPIASVDGYPVFERVAAGRGEIIHVADASAFDNSALKRGGKEYAVFLNGLFLPSRDGRVALYRERSWVRGGTDPVRALFSGPFLPMTLQALLAFIVFAAGAAARFGNPQRLDPRARRSTAAHLDAVASFYARGRPEAMADKANAEHFQEAARARLGMSARASPAAVAERLARECGIAAGRAMDLMSGKESPRRGDAARRSAERMDILDRIKGRRAK